MSAKFSRQHYQIIASALHEASNAHPSAQLGILKTLLADTFEEDNARFSRDHFFAVAKGQRAVNSRPPRKRAGALETVACPWCKKPITDEDGKPVSEDDAPACPVCTNPVCGDCSDSHGHCPACSCFERCDECGAELEEGQIGLCDDCQKPQRARKSARKVVRQ